MRTFKLPATTGLWGRSWKGRRANDLRNDDNAYSGVMNTVKRWRDTASELADFDKSISSAGKYGKIHTKA